MKHLDLNAFMSDVHQNAVNHGWWDEPRTDGTIRALFHSELSEALEEHRSGRANVWHACAYGGMCEFQDVHMGAFDCKQCTPAKRKPEGVSVELMDFVIRVFDYLAQQKFAMPASMNTAQKLRDWAMDDYQDDYNRDVLTMSVPDLVDVLHTEIALSDVMHSVTYLTTAAGLALAWVEHHGLDPVQLLEEKHAYNLTRTYKHGGKVC